MAAGGRFRPFLEWAAAPPKGLLRTWGITPDVVAATAVFRGFLRTFGPLPALAAETVYLLLRLLFLPRAARAVLRRWDLRAYDQRMKWERARPPTRPRSVRPRG